MQNRFHKKARQAGMILAAVLLSGAVLAGCGADRALTLEELQLQTGAGETRADKETQADAAVPAGEAGGAASASDAGQNPQTPVQGADAAMQQTQPPGTIFVHVCGAVQNPDVYELPEGSRAMDALEAAGGLTPDADRAFVNLAQPVTDGQKLYFPTAEETAKSGYSPVAESAAGQSSGQNSGQTGAGDGLVHLNTATPEELQTLPGIGASRVRDIIAYREAHGGFSSKEELKEVSGIGEASYGKLEDLIAVP
ncbi:MAG: helix-hairpin-helix domain-containing protein [Lachnospiraceae bacterium]|nr:helix-hairpin-helix domain-containing protein [Lachnospiraceae bacterium]